MAPLIGISTYSDFARWRDWSSPAALIPRTYVDAVRRSGGRPVLLPPGGDRRRRPPPSPTWTA